jgi:hypothetical protein
MIQIERPGDIWSQSPAVELSWWALDATRQAISVILHDADGYSWHMIAKQKDGSYATEDAGFPQSTLEDAYAEMEAAMNSYAAAHVPRPKKSGLRDALGLRDVPGIYTNEDIEELRAGGMDALEARRPPSGFCQAVISHWTDDGRVVWIFCARRCETSARFCTEHDTDG